MSAAREGAKYPGILADVDVFDRGARGGRRVFLLERYLLKLILEPAVAAPNAFGFEAE